MEGRRQMEAFRPPVDTGAGCEKVDLDILAKYIKDVTVQGTPTDLSLQHGDGIDIVHLNYQTNVKEIGTLFTIQVGERHSRTLNQRGLYRYMDWTLTDLLSVLAKIKSAAFMKDPNLRTMIRNAEALLSSLPGVNCREADIPDIDSKHTNRLNAILSLLEKFVLSYCQTLGNNANIRGELIRSLGSIRALAQLLKAHISNDGSISRIQELILLGLLVHEKIYQKGMDHWSLHLLKLEKDPKKNQLELLLCEFRNCVFVNLMDVGWKCILYSTGLPGFKVGSTTDVLRNPHVMPLLPPYIQSPDGVHMNRDFRDFFIGASQYRGGDGVGSSA
ncbi:hypothetical protein SARC_07735 [Sphaeroforma arctica JP610]|uniref:Uncharacterized protein n=1 Tax=Sphaeroforma arctica JP610 TaxID=667725 RepID=A0A0L0FTI0_9EUKA|nr:hypothetical protein SARC_07735 [Sphaeroforma arctica JP610]KNC79881.1 hypothetical protein SARC_07735 [Sphaeroforma arctica JP610]|eukprot:XP_014153783.1 hypothetical protein SARC_07735 [Sphaeroforma arctica JP610]